tara:strand:+ start:708 stop:1217 length:510 start_codon:yes stop_codon:yes gene_type:complete
MEYYTLVSARISNKGELNSQYNNYSVNLKFQGHQEDALWNLREKDFHLGQIDGGRLVGLPGLVNGTIFKGKVEHLTSARGKAYTRFKGDVDLSPPPEVDHDLAPGPALFIVDPTMDDVIDTWTYLVGRAQIGFAKINVQADAQSLNAAAATMMIDLQKKGVKIPTSVKE